MTVGELIAELGKLPVDALVYVDLHQADCFPVEGVDHEEDDGETTVYVVCEVGD